MGKGVWQVARFRQRVQGPKQLDLLKRPAPLKETWGSAGDR